MTIFKKQLTRCLKLFALLIAAFAYAWNTHAAVINKSGQSISGTLSYGENGVNQYLFTDAKLQSGAVLTFGAGAYMTNSNFDRMVLNSNSRMEVGTGYLELAGLTSFKSMSIGGELLFKDVHGGINIDLSGSTVLAGGALRFLSPGDWNQNAVINLSNMKIYGTLDLSGAASLNGTNFSGTYFGGTTTIQNIANGNFAGASFAGTSTLQNITNAKFTGARYLAGSKTTINNSIQGAVFNGITLEGERDGLDGAQFILSRSEIFGVEFGAISIENGALMHIDATAYADAQITDFTGITVNAGGSLNINADGWQRNWTNAKFDNAAFNGNVFFGVNDGLDTSNEWNYLILDGASFKGSGFAGATDFKWVNLNNADFSDAVMNGLVNFTGASTGESGIARGISFKKAKLSGDVNFTRMNMERSLFNNAELSGSVTFTSTNLTNADFRSDGSSDMSVSGQVLFDSSTLDGANFTGVKFISPANKKIVFNNSSMVGTVFNNADFSGVVDFKDGSAKNAKFIDSKFGGDISFTTIDMTGADFTRAVLNGTVLFDSLALENVNFTGAQFSSPANKKIIFSNSSMGEALFNGADFSGVVEFKNISATNAKFIGSNFDGNILFSRIELTGSDFTGAVLNGIVDFDNSTLEGVKFADASFVGTTTIYNITNGNFTGAKYLAGSKTTLINSIKGTLFNGIALEAAGGGLDGAQLILKPSNTAGVAFGQVSIGNGALLYIDALGYDGSLTTDLSGIRVDAGGNLNINADGWQRDWTQAKFDNAAFNGNVFFGVNDSNAYNYLVLNGASFKGSGFGGTTDFKWVNLNNAVFDDTVMNGTVNFTGASNGLSGIAKGISFKNAKLGGNVNFTRMNMESALFNNADLSGDITFASTNLAGADFTSADNSVMSLSGQILFDSSTLDTANFTGAEFSSSAGKKIVFSNSSMTGTLFNNANFSGVVEFNSGSAKNAKFIGSNLGGDILFSGVNMTGADFTMAVLDGTVNFNSSTLDTVNFSGAQFSSPAGKKIAFNNSSMTGTLFNNANFSGIIEFNNGSAKNAKFIGSNLGGDILFSGVNMTGADFTMAVLDGTVDFVRTALSASSFEGASLSGDVNFTGTRDANGRLTSGDMIGAGFKDAVFDGNVKFENVDIDNGNFTGAKLGGNLDFKHANLTGAVLENADLTGTVKFVGEKSATYQQISGNMGGANLKGAHLGSGVSFKDMYLNKSDFSASSARATVIDGAVFSNTGLSETKFNGATIKGNTSFEAYTWFDKAVFDGATFESAGGSTVKFTDAYMGNTSFNGTSFNGNVLFYDSGNAGFYDNADFSGANFNAGSNVVFDGNGGRMGGFIFAGNKNLAGKLTFQNLDAGNLDFSGTDFGELSDTHFSNTSITGASFENMVLKDGGQFTVDGLSTISGVSFAGAEFGAGSTFNFHDVKFEGGDNSMDFSNAKFGGDTNFATGTTGIDLSGANFAGAEFIYDTSSPRTMFNLQYTNISFDQLRQTKNFDGGRLDFRGMNLSGNGQYDSSYNGNDWRGALLDNAKFGGFYGNDFRDSIHNGTEVDYGASYIDAEGRLFGLNSHTSSTHPVFKIRPPDGGSSLSGVYLQADSTMLREGVTLEVGSGNHIYAVGRGLGLNVAGKIIMDSSSMFHMQDGAQMNILESALFEITVEAGANYIVLGDADALSSITLSGAWTADNLTVLGDTEIRDWMLEVMDNQLVLYYVPEPAEIAMLFGALALVAVSCRRRKMR